MPSKPSSLNNLTATASFSTPIVATMPPRKRAAPATSTKKQDKRLKSSKVDESTRTVQTTGVDITAQNAINSPLLRLPGELRNRIWDLCYGDMTFRFGLHLERDAANRYTGDNLLGLRVASRRSEFRTDIPKLVCKQVWFESSQVMFATALLKIDNPDACHILSQSPPIWLQYIRRLFIDINYVSLDDLREWARGLTVSLTERFTNLEGLHLDFLGYICSTMNIFPWRPDFLKDKRWVSTKMPLFIRSLQQHKLRPELTTVNWKEIDYVSLETSQNSHISEVIRAELLTTHSPRRKSRRGKSGDGDSI